LACLRRCSGGFRGGWHLRTQGRAPNDWELQKIDRTYKCRLSGVIEGPVFGVVSVRSAAFGTLVEGYNAIVELVETDLFLRIELATSTRSWIAQHSFSGTFVTPASSSRTNAGHASDHPIQALNFAQLDFLPLGIVSGASDFASGDPLSSNIAIRAALSWASSAAIRSSDHGAASITLSLRMM
jgi:hypothetical protein